MRLAPERYCNCYYCYRKRRGDGVFNGHSDLSRVPKNLNGLARSDDRHRYCGIVIMVYGITISLAPTYNVTDEVKRYFCHKRAE